MIDLRRAKTICIIGGGTAGWFAAISLRKFFAPSIKIQLIESPKVGIIGVGEGGLINLVTTLNRLNIPTSQFMRETGASLKWGFCYEGWRTGTKDDEFYHLFANTSLAPFHQQYAGVLPCVSGLVAQNITLSHVIKDFDKIQKRATQQEAIDALVQQSGISTSFHFDSQRVADFLKKIACERGVEYVQAHVQDFQLNEQGLVTEIHTDQQKIETDFVIDASGFSRLLIGKKLKSAWHSFKKYLWLDKAIPFHFPHHGRPPELVTRATAMKAGWMWQIPLIERIGAGYVFSSEFSTEQEAIDEMVDYFGESIEPHKTISFEPGHFEKVWQKNVMALGLASGFVEPLEATSIGQMLEQLRMFEQIIYTTGGVVSDLSIQQFNQANADSWQGIRDFLRMHYDCPRRDTPFWNKVAQTPYPESYRALKEVFMQRTPRMQDIQGYATYGWHGIFHVVNWIIVAQALGLISQEGCINDLKRLPKEQIEHVNEYLKWVHQHYSI